MTTPHPMTLERYRATGRDVADIGKAIHDEIMSGRAGRLYGSGNYIERNADGSFTLTVCNYSATLPLPQLEAELHDWALAEGWLEDEPEAEAIAAEFTLRLRERLSADEFAEMQRRNAASTDSLVCHSHDFCDANVPMSDAFEAVTGREPLGSADASTEQNDDDCFLWNRAWEIAKERYITAPEGEAK